MAIRDDIQHILQNCNYFSCAQDGSEARKTRDEKELVYVKVVIRGEPVELLLKCQQMSKFGGVTGASVKSAIDDAFTDYSLSVSGEKYRKCLISACADGAAVHLGKLRGALTELKADRPWLLIIHCSAHRIELAVKDAFKESPEFELIDEMMLNLHYFFRNSGKCWRILLLVAEKLDVLIHRFPKSSGTRFQAHKYRGLKVLIVNFLPLCLFAEIMLEANNKACDTQQKAKLQGYLHKWLSYQYLTSLQLYRLVLQETAHLSFVCQSSKTLVTEVVEEMEKTCQRLNDLSQRDTDFPFPVQEENDSVTGTAEATNLPATQRFKETNQLTEKQRLKAEKCISIIRESYAVKRVNQGRKSVKRIKEKLIPAIATYLTTRLKSFDDDIFKAFKIADHPNYDYMNAEYGERNCGTFFRKFEIPWILFTTCFERMEFTKAIDTNEIPTFH